MDIQNVSVVKGNRHILTDVTFSIQPAQIVTVIGPNGAGKTTLLRVVLGLLPPTSGQVKCPSNLKIGYMPQKISLNAALPLTVERFLRLNAPNSQAIAATLASVGAEHLMTYDLHALSGGELQRVLLGRALLMQPDLLILDEPAQGVDVVGQAELYQRLDQLRHQTGCSILLVSHDLHTVMAASDLVLCLNGHLCCSGHPRDIQYHPHYLQLFGPAAARTAELAGLAPYTHHHDHHHGPCAPLP